MIPVQGGEEKSSLRAERHQVRKQEGEDKCRRKGKAGKKLGNLVSLGASLSIMRLNSELMDLP